MGKIVEIRNLYKETLKDIAKSEDNWLDFLDSSSWNFKYGFDDQVLIYAQRPDAKACAEMEIWNKKVHRWVNKNAKYIFVNSKGESQYPYRLVFDVSDTHNYKNTNYKLWEVKKNYEDEIIETLENAFGDIDSKENLAQAINLSAYNMVVDNIQDYITSIEHYKSKTELENMAEEDIKSILIPTVWASVSYMMMKRCGIDARNEINKSEISFVRNFNEENLLTILGTATSDIAEMGLREIAKTVVSLENKEKNKNRTFENNSNLEYSNNENKEKNGGKEHGESRIYETWELSNSEYSSRGGENSNRKIRENENELFEKSQESRIHNSLERQEVRETSDEHTGGSNNDDGRIDSGDGEERRNNGRNENERSVQMGRNDEQLEKLSRRNSGERDDIHLSPTLEEQLEIIEQAEAEKAPAFSFSQEMIDEVLVKGSGFVDGKFRINEQFNKSLSNKENADFLKKEYGIGGRSWENRTWIDYNSKGIKFENDNNKLILSWSQVEKRIKELIKLDRYLNPKEKNEYEEWLLNQEREEELRKSAKQIESNELETKYEYHLGDTVYLGADEYEIESIGINNIQLYDPKYPLFGREINKDEFERKIRENPSNEHLIKKENTEVKKIEDKPLVERLHKFLNEYDIYDVDEITLDEVQKTLNDNQELLDTINYFYELLDSEDILDEFSSELTKFINELSEIYEKSQEEKPIVKEEKVEELIPTTIKRIRTNNNISNYNLHPEIPQEERNQYVIKNNLLGEGTPKEKFERNIEAIKILKKCEEENRYANPEEQEKLVQYVGWGGLSKAFDINESGWSEEYKILKDLLNEEEYTAARASTLTAFYTPPIVISSIYKILKNMGLEEGNILEPSCGIGNFFGMLPEELKKCKMYGIELDSITGRIAEQLYQKSNIAVNGYEKVDIPDSFFDVAVGNVPFGDFKVNDKRYDKNNFLIHDYFFGKTLDKVRPGGVIIFVTSKGTMDKENSSVRKYIAQRAELLGAIRLPNNTFSKNAGTEVTSDIIILKKRENITDIEPDWVNLDRDINGIKMNEYFVKNPEMILGTMEMKSTQFGMDSTCKPNEDVSLENLLDYAITNINGEIEDYQIDIMDEEDKSIPADPTVRNFSYCIVNGKTYFRENSRMYLQDLPVTSINRIKGMIELRDCVRNLIELQTDDFPDEDIKREQQKLNSLYDNYTKEYGLINSRGNSVAFSEDSSYFLLCSLEVLDSNGNFIRKADMFNKRTIKPYKEIKNVDTSNEALILSLSERAKVDLDYMSQLTNKRKEEIIEDLKGVIFKVPLENEKYVTADEYLSGNVREKLKLAEAILETNPEFQINVDRLKQVIPKDITASEIGIKLGSTWIPENIIKQFMFELLDTPQYVRWNMNVSYSNYNSEWYVENKNYDSGNVKAYRTYGTKRINAYKIIEQTLNLKDVKIFDTEIDENGDKIRVFNKQETAIAQAKQEQIKAEFENWIWKDTERRDKLVKLYNERFNSIRPREYNGDTLSFSGMNPEITLRPHQTNAIAHILYGGNTLLAHEVGAGKTFEMVAAAMESKRLGLCNKSLFVVPNHIIEQFASEFLQLYPSANVLVATKKDFSTANRKKFCSRIATGDYDAIIIGHSQFERIPMSTERQKYMIQQQIKEILLGVEEAKRNKGENFTIKQLEKSKKQLETKLEKLNKQDRKDDVITFEELGVDRLFVDEAHRI